MTETPQSESVWILTLLLLLTALGLKVWLLFVRAS